MGLNIGRNKTRNIECNAWRNRAMFVGVNIGRNNPRNMTRNTKVFDPGNICCNIRATRNPSPWKG
jgi:hypothetical protein